MYYLDLSILQKNLRKYRKIRNLTLEALGKNINKSKATVSKYEKGEIIPDILTVLEICNILNINLSQLLPMTACKPHYSMINPFHSDKLYLYYYTEKKLILSILEIQSEENSVFVKLYNGITNIKHYETNSCYYYEGILDCDKTIGYIKLYNPNFQETQLENLQISFSIPWSKKFQYTNFFILGLTPNSLPVVKKGILSHSPIKNISQFKNNLQITKSDLSNIQKNNAWILHNNNYDYSYLL